MLLKSTMLQLKVLCPNCKRECLYTIKGCVYCGVRFSKDFRENLRGTLFKEVKAQINEHWKILFTIFAAGYYLGYNRPLSHFDNLAVFCILTLPIFILTFAEVFDSLYDDLNRKWYKHNQIKTVFSGAIAQHLQPCGGRRRTKLETWKRDPYAKAAQDTTIKSRNPNGSPLCVTLTLDKSRCAWKILLCRKGKAAKIDKVAFLFYKVQHS